MWFRKSVACLVAMLRVRWGFLVMWRSVLLDDEGGLPVLRTDNVEPAPLCRRAPRWSRLVAVDTVAIADAVSVVLGAVIPAYVYTLAGGELASWYLVWQSGLCAALIVVLCFKAWGMYDSARMHDFPADPLYTAAALLLSLLAVFGFGAPQIESAGDIWVWYMSWAGLSFASLILARGFARRLLQRLTARGRFDQRIAVYGAGPIARRVREHLVGSASGVHFVGTFEDRSEERLADTDGVDVSGKLADLLEVSRREEVDRIIVALPQTAEGRIKSIVKTLEQLPVTVQIVTHIASDMINPTALHRVSSLGSIGLIDIKAKPLADWAPLVKRAEDVVVSLGILALFSPVLPLIALAIKLDSPGPILFRQNRRGLNKHEFKVLKFRTMTVAENGSSVRQAIKNDARVTRVGWWLRRTSMDELPQLVNVLQGKMSLVGPRPHAIVHDDQFEQMLEDYANRHQVKPGITGLAQVNGCRGETDTSDKIKARVDYDIEYIKNWSFWLDMKIIVQTVLTVLSARNAY